MDSILQGEFVGEDEVFVAGRVGEMGLCTEVPVVGD